jgi:murein DD-endopeptidase MepM/ murein hydrolase activator NlpD
MRRAVLVAAFLTAAPAAQARTFTDEVISGEAPAVAPIAQTFARVVAEIEHVMPHALLDRIVSFERSLRDLAHDANGKLLAWASQLPNATPDLGILTSSPLGGDEESSGFGWRDDPIRHTRHFHSGTDFRADPGTPVLAAGAGVVVFAGRQGGYGNCIYVDHGGGVVTLYAHLRRIETAKDAAVTAGERIGQVGSTGRTTGPHLHFEVRLEGRPVSPVTAMTVAAMQREDPEAGRLAAFALSPALQAKAVDGSDRQRSNRTRPERAGRAQRQQVLW